MNLFSKALLGVSKKTYEPIISRISVARVTVTKPENYSSPDSDYSVIESQATSASGSRYIYVYPKEEFWNDFASGNIVFVADGNAVPLTVYSTSNNRFGIGSLERVPTGTYHIYVYNNKTQKNIFKIELIWTNNI
jgi:hypothetical protein